MTRAVSRFDAWKAADQALNRWNLVKFRIMKMLGPENYPEREIGQIGRFGFRAARAIDCLDKLIGTVETERFAEYAQQLLDAEKRADYRPRQWHKQMIHERSMERPVPFVPLKGIRETCFV